MWVTIGKKSQPSGELVELLLECHGKIRQFTALARELGERRDHSTLDVVDGCNRVERYFVEALPLHVRDEEESILPRLVGHRDELDRALSQMRLEHRAHEPLLAELLSACRALREAPSEAVCRLELAQAAGQLSVAFEAHLAREEELIFPALRQFLSDSERAQISSELRARRHSP